jgi:hypothetical protein
MKTHKKGKDGDDVPLRVRHSRPARRRRRNTSPLSFCEDRSLRRADKSTSFAASPFSVLLNSRDISSTGFGFASSVTASSSFGVAVSLRRILVEDKFRTAEFSIRDTELKETLKTDCRLI